MKIILNGSCGRMGRHVQDLIASKPDQYQLAATVDISGNADFKSLSEVNCEADVIIDFSYHSAIKELIEYSVKRNLPVIICTTGHTPEEISIIESAYASIPVFFSSNMSIGIAVLAKLAKQAVLAMPGADIEIVETHHNRKLDAPSGTAVMLADSIKQVRPELKVNTGRSGYGKRDPNELGIHSIRIGNVVGEHEIIISTDSQTLRLKHEAHDRKLFAEGSLTAAEFICGKPAGKYTMNDILN